MHISRLLNILPVKFRNMFERLGCGLFGLVLNLFGVWIFLNPRRLRDEVIRRLSRRRNLIAKAEVEILQGDWIITNLRVGSVLMALFGLLLIWAAIRGTRN